MSWLPSSPQPAKKAGGKYLKPPDVFKVSSTSNKLKQSVLFGFHSSALGILCDYGTNQTH